MVSHPTIVAHQLSHLEKLAKNSLGLSAMLSSTTSSEISRRAALSETTSRTNENADAGAEYSYLTTTSLCDTHSTNNIQGSNEELTNAQLKYAQEEAEKAAKRQLELVERRRQLSKDTVAMKLRIINDVDEKKRKNKGVVFLEWLCLILYLGSFNVVVVVVVVQRVFGLIQFNLDNSMLLLLLLLLLLQFN